MSAHPNLTPIGPPATIPILLFNDECAICRRIAGWVRTSSSGPASSPSIAVRPIGDDPSSLRALNPNLDIWAAYETIHVAMPDGSMKLGGEAVAETLRRLPNCRWFAWVFALSLFGFRPFQRLLDLGYLVLSDARPLLGCESCGIPSPWVKFVRSIFTRSRHGAHKSDPPGRSPHFTKRYAGVIGGTRARSQVRATAI